MGVPFDSEYSEFCESIQELLFQSPSRTTHEGKGQAAVRTMKTFRRHQAGREFGLKEHAEFQSLWWRAALSAAPRMFFQSSKHNGVRSLLLLPDAGAEEWQLLALTPQLCSPRASFSLCTDKTLAQLCWETPRHQKPLRNTQLGCRTDVPLTHSCQLFPNN